MVDSWSDTKGRFDAEKYSRENGTGRKMSCFMKHTTGVVRVLRTDGDVVMNQSYAEKT